MRCDAASATAAYADASGSVCCSFVEGRRMPSGSAASSYARDHAALHQAPGYMGIVKHI